VTRRAAAPESVLPSVGHTALAWAWVLTNPDDGSALVCLELSETRKALDGVTINGRGVRRRRVAVRIVREADYRRLLRAAAGKREAKG